jgi:hypothetical protein
MVWSTHPGIAPDDVERCGDQDTGQGFTRGTLGERVASPVSGLFHRGLSSTVHSEPCSIAVDSDTQG